MKLKNKTILILLLILFFILIGITKSQALTNDNFVFENIPQTVIDFCNAQFNNSYSPEEYYYIIIKWQDEYQIHFVEKSKSIYSYSNSKLKVSAVGHKYYILGIEGTTITSGSHTNNNAEINFQTSFKDNKYYLPLYSSSDIYTDNTYTDFFFKAPVVDKAVIPVLEGVEELPKAMTTTLRLIIPVCLSVFGTLLLIYIIRLLILRVT